MPPPLFTRIEFLRDPDPLGSEAPDVFEVNPSNPLPSATVDLEGNTLWVGRGGGLIGGFLPYNIASQATFTVKEGWGVLHALTFNKPIATAVITIYDAINTVANGTLLGTITIPASPMLTYFLYDVEFQRGLMIVQGTATSDITVSYR